MGPTASGKTHLSILLAKKLDGEIINCDSVQFYQGFDIGSAKATLEERREIPHHFIDCATWDEPWDAALFAQKARDCIHDISSRSKTPIIVGGSGLYFRTLWGEKFHDLPNDEKIRERLKKLPGVELFERLKEIDPKRATELHVNDTFRVVRALEIFEITGQTFSALTQMEQNTITFPTSLKILLNIDKQKLLKRIELRSRQMLQAGLIDEVKGLLAAGVSEDSMPMKSIGYGQVLDFLHGKCSEKLLLEKIIIATRQYAKRQRTWFKSVKDVYCIEKELDEDLVSDLLLRAREQKNML